MKRLFAAIKINPAENLLGSYYGLKRNLKDEKIKWVDIDNIHITLKFYGETDEIRIPEISDKLKTIASNYSNFIIEIKNIGVFGSEYKPRLIWLGITENKQLSMLAYDILSEMHKLGFKQDRQNFVPHITLGRIKYIEDKVRFQQVIDQYKFKEIQKQEVLGLSLYESILKPTGPEYKVIEEFHLNA